MINEERSEVLPEALLETIRDAYNPPGRVPREEIWAGIEARLTMGYGAGRAARLRAALVPPVRAPVMAAAAIIFLLLGVGIGRVTAPEAGLAGASPGSERSAVASAPSGIDAAAPGGVEQGLAPPPRSAGGPGTDGRPDETTLRAAALLPTDPAPAAPSDAPADRVPQSASAPSVMLAGVSEGSALSLAGLAMPPDATDPENDTALDPTSPSSPALAHLQDADVLLDILVVEGADARVRGHAARWAEFLLAETRLLREIYADSESELTRLLQELEGTLVQVAALDGVRAEDGIAAVQSIMQVLEDRGLRERIHAYLPDSVS